MGNQPFSLPPEDVRKASPGAGPEGRQARLRVRGPNASWRQVSERHSRFVARAKLALPILAGVLMLLVVAWPQLKQKAGFTPGFAKLELGGTAKTLAMINARFLGTDDKNQPFTVTADKAVQASAEDQLVELTLPRADLNLSDGGWVALGSDVGLFHRDDQTLELVGSVDLFHDNGYEMRTASARIDLGAGTAEGEDPVEGQGPLGTLTSQGFKLTDRGERILFTGKARMVVQTYGDSSETKPGAKPGEKPGGAAKSAKGSQKQ